jgi:hypothetical protein
MSVREAKGRVEGPGIGLYHSRYGGLIDGRTTVFFSFFLLWRCFMHTVRRICLEMLAGRRLKPHNGISPLLHDLHDLALAYAL